MKKIKEIFEEIKYWFSNEKRNGCYLGFYYDRMIMSKSVHRERGEYYHFVLVKDNKIIAFGEEQGNYAGGVYATNEGNYEFFILQKEDLKKRFPELYRKVKNIPYAGKNQYPSTWKY